MQRIHNRTDRARGPVAGIQRFFNTLWYYRWGYLFVAPLIIGLITFTFYPFLQSFYLALFDKTDKAASFIGLQNFVEMLTDEVFIESWKTMGKIILPKLLISVLAPLMMAEMIFAVRNGKLQGIYRILILLPIIAPGVVNMLIWKQVYAGTGGMLNEILQALNITASNIDWLNDTKYVLFAIVFLGFPWVGGTGVLIYMSGLMNISSEVIEASRLDGCNGFNRILHIDLPLLLGQIRYFVVFGIIGNIQDFSVQMVLTKGGPDGFFTYVPAYYMYKMAFTHNRFGYAAAIGVVLFAVIAVITAATYKMLNKEVDV